MRRSCSVSLFKELTTKQRPITSPSTASDPPFRAADHVPVTGGLLGAITETPYGRLLVGLPDIASIELTDYRRSGMQQHDRSTIRSAHHAADSIASLINHAVFL